MSIPEFVNEANIIQKIDKLAKANKYGTVDGTQMNGKTAREIIAMFKHPKMNSHRNQMLKMKSHELVDLSIRLLKPLKIKVESVNEAKKPVEIKLQGITFGKDYQGLSFKNGGVQYYYQKGKGAKHVESDYGKFIVKIGQLVTPATREKVAKKLKESVNEAKKYDTYTIIRKYSPTSKQYKIYVQTSHRLLPQHKKNIKKPRSPENWEIWGHDGPDFYGPNKKGAKLVFSGATNEVKLNEDNIKFSKEEMAQLHKDGKIEKDGHTYIYSED